MRALLCRAALIAPAAFLLGAAVALASESAGHGSMPLDKILWELGIKILDISIIAYFAFKYLSKPLQQAMANRSQAVRSALEEATAGRRDAEARLAEFQAKAAGLDSEIEAMRSQAAADLERERALLIAEGKVAAEHVAQHARETIRQETAKARAQLHREAADLAVRLAEEHVRSAMTDEDQRHLAGSYLKQMETVR